ncbi:uncharacterized protein LOC117641112 [Thrips palmi]|uniref:Uncharacterized protein LOC117641112 n=1 Tax=Thrips palmi TaxID=161013 RepID=A0A6P8YCQ0_THRPL|nr:uncharacterized protein LOC117641112 [Thrips palmi]
MKTLSLVVLLAAAVHGSLTTRSMRRDQDTPLAFPMESLFKAANYTRGAAGRSLAPPDDIKDEDIFTAVMTEPPPDTELFPDDGTRIGEYSPCALALLRALPSGPRGRAIVLATLAASLFSVRSALRKPMTVVVQGLFVAKRVMQTDRRRADSHAADLLPPSPYDWASIFDALEVSNKQ